MSDAAYYCQKIHTGKAFYLIMLKKKQCLSIKQREATQDKIMQKLRFYLSTATIFVLFTLRFQLYYRIIGFSKTPYRSRGIVCIVKTER